MPPFQAKHILLPLFCLLSSAGIAHAAPEDGTVSDWQAVLGTQIAVTPSQPVAEDEAGKPEAAPEQQAEIAPIAPVQPAPTPVEPAPAEEEVAQEEEAATRESETTLVIEPIMPVAPQQTPAPEAEPAPVEEEGAPVEEPAPSPAPEPAPEAEAAIEIEAEVEAAVETPPAAEPAPEPNAEAPTTSAPAKAPAPAAAKPESELTGREIALKMDRAQHVKDATRVSSMLIERRGQQLTRKMLMRAKRYGVDERSLIRFEEPADVRDTQYLSWVYEDPQKDDDLWVYFPSENMVRRISGGGKKGSFMRSDFANEDIEARAVDDDTHVRLDDSVLEDTPVYVIESTPIPIKAKDSSYSKRKIWVNREISLPLRVEFYDKRGKLFKILRYGGIEEIDGVWSATKLIMETPRKKSRTLMQYHDVTYNSGLGDDLFNQSTLKR